MTDYAEKITIPTAWFGFRRAIVKNLYSATNSSSCMQPAKKFEATSTVLSVAMRDTLVL